MYGPPAAMESVRKLEFCTLPASCCQTCLIPHHGREIYLQQLRYNCTNRRTFSRFLFHPFYSSQTKSVRRILDLKTPDKFLWVQKLTARLVITSPFLMEILWPL